MAGTRYFEKLRFWKNVRVHLFKKKTLQVSIKCLFDVALSGEAEGSRVCTHSPLSTLGSLFSLLAISGWGGS